MQITFKEQITIPQRVILYLAQNLKKDRNYEYKTISIDASKHVSVDLCVALVDRSNGSETTKHGDGRR